jgi:ABC-type multidrug transport system fused ATPase/permease subunit
MIKILRVYKDLNFFLGKKIANRLIYLLVILLITSIVEMATLSLFPIYISLLLDKGNIQEVMGYDINNINFFMPLSSTLLNFSLILIICLFFKIIFILFSYYYELTMMKKIKSAASDKLYANYINRSFSYFININSSIIYRVIIQDVNEAAAYISSITTLVREFFILTIITSLLLIYNAEVALISIIVFSLLGSIFYFSTTFALKKNALIRVAAAKKKISMVSEMFNGIKEIKVFFKENFFIGKFSKANNDFENSIFFRDLLTKTPKLFFEFLAVSLLVLITFFFLYSGNNSEAILPLLGLLTICVIRLVPVFSSINSSLTYLRSHKISYENLINELNNFSNTKLDNRNLLENNSNKHENPNILVKIKDMNFKYNKDQDLILKNISIDIKKNEIIGLMGKSGSGKTTLINLILGLLKKQSGEYYLKKKAIISYVPQDIYILDSSLKENIAFGIEKNLINEQKISECIERSQLKELINNKNLGEDTTTGEKGSKFSGGERQRVGIARALYNNSSLLIFDEATNALDTQTENEIIKTLLGLKNKLSIIIVSHHLSSLKICDKIYYLNEGKIKDEGNLSELLIRYPHLKENNEKN